MRVQARAIIWIDGRLIVVQQSSCGQRSELTLPGGHVDPHESIAETLKREVAEKTGLEIVPGALLYVSEDDEANGTHVLELIFRAEASGVPALCGRFAAIDVDSHVSAEVGPAILEQIAADARDGWRDIPKWLGATRAKDRGSWDAMPLRKPASAATRAEAACHRRRDLRQAPGVGDHDPVAGCGKTRMLSWDGEIGCRAS